MALDLCNGAEAADGECTSREFARLLTEAAAFLLALWPDRPGLAIRLDDLATRLWQERLRIAVLGQFKRGKSTFLNALLGHDLLPSGVVPVTAIPTFLRWGPECRADITYLEDQRIETIAAADTREIAATLRRYVTEEGNPRNQARVSRVEVFLPAPLLASGIELIDTPGIGSTLHHNTDAAVEVLPECDAAFFVVAVDPPVTAAELEYLDRARSGIWPILFVLNKVDYLSSDERPIALDFLKRTLQSHSTALANQPIFEMSARTALKAAHERDPTAIEQSGLGAVERYLGETLLKAKRDIVRAAIAQKAAAILDLARADVALGVRALEMPLSDLAVRAAQFGEAVTDIERQRVIAADLLAGDRRRLRQAVEQRADALRKAARTDLHTLIDDAFTWARAITQAEQTSKALIADAIPRLFQDALERSAREIAGEMDESLAGHINRAEEIIGAVRKNAAQLFDIPYAGWDTAENFVSIREPYWVTQKWHDALLPLAAGILDRLLPAAVARRRAKRRLTAEVDSLVARNIENLRWATIQNIDEAYRRFSAWFDERLAEAIEATRGAITAAQERRRHQAGEAEGELRHLRSTLDLVTDTIARLSAMQLPGPGAIGAVLAADDGGN
jgi:GTP-binding protein EngB required for normal cell division